MFFSFITNKNEKIVVNSAHIILVSETKKGILVATDDGNAFYCLDEFSDFLLRISSVIH